MANLSEILDGAHEGEAIAVLGRELGLTPEQTQSAIAALLPAISTGLKQSTSTVEGLGSLFAVMGQQKTLYALYDDPETALEPQGRAAGNDALSVIFGSPDVSLAVIGQAQKFSGVDAGILKKMLPALAGIVLSGLMRSRSSASPVPAPAAPAPSSGDMGGLGDILGQIFGRGATASPAPQVPAPAPTDAGGQTAPGGDLLGALLRELMKGIQDGRIKPVVIGGGPIQVPLPGGQAPSGPDASQIPGGDVFGKILRDVLGGALGTGAAQTPQGGQPPAPPMKDLSDLTKQLGVMGGAGAAVFGEKLEHGLDVEPSLIDSIQSVLERSRGAERR